MAEKRKLEESMDELSKIFGSPSQPNNHQNNEALEPETRNTTNEENASSASSQNDRYLRPKLTKTPELIEQVARVISMREYLADLRGKLDIPIWKNEATDSLVTQDTPDKKYRATSFDINSITIGEWQAHTRQQKDLVGKFYYNKKKIVWEVLAGRRKKKLEIKYDYIIAIKATIGLNEPEILQILLKEAPDFKEEAPLEKGKNTRWEDCGDFTGGLAFIYRTHTVICPVGALGKDYKILLKSNRRLLELSQQPFPTDYDPVFPQIPPINLRTASQYNSHGGSPFNPLYWSINPPPPVMGFGAHNGAFINGALYCNHIQGQVNPIQGHQVPNYTYGSEAGNNYLNMVPLTSLDNMMTASEPTGDVFDDEDGESTFGSH